jgi:glutathione S-transferase
MIKVYGNVKTRTFRILWLLEELQVPYENIPIDFRQQEHKSDWFLKINPLGKVPAIVVDNICMFESAAIMIFLCEKYGTASFAIPSHTQTKAAFFQWIHFFMSELDGSLWVLAKHKFAYPKALRCVDACPGALHDFKRGINVINQHLTQTEYPYMLGESFTAVDLLLTTIITWTKTLKIAELVPLRIMQWANANTQRPAFQKIIHH